MINMKMSAEESAEQLGGVAESREQYPYGLCLSLDDESMSKLGLEATLAVGTVIRIVADCRVVTTSQRADENKESESSMSLQITDMEIDGDKQGVDPERLYGETK